MMILEQWCNGYSFIATRTLRSSEAQYIISGQSPIEDGFEVQSAEISRAIAADIEFE